MAWSPNSECFHPPEAVEGHRHRDRDANPDDADLHAVGEVARRAAVAREDRGAVAEVVLVDELGGSLEVVDAHDAEVPAQNLFAVDAHLRLEVVAERSAKEETVGPRAERTCGHRPAAGALLATQLDIAGNLVEMRLRDQRAEIDLGCAR
jgi:hypothetical protein